MRSSPTSAFSSPLVPRLFLLVEFSPFSSFSAPLLTSCSAGRILARSASSACRHRSWGASEGSAVLGRQEGGVCGPHQESREVGGARLQGDWWLCVFFGKRSPGDGLGEQGGWGRGPRGVHAGAAGEEPVQADGNHESVSKSMMSSQEDEESIPGVRTTARQRASWGWTGSTRRGHGSGQRRRHGLDAIVGGAHPMGSAGFVQRLPDNGKRENSDAASNRLTQVTSVGVAPREKEEKRRAAERMRAVERARYVAKRRAVRRRRAVVRRKRKEEESCGK